MSNASETLMEHTRNPPECHASSIDDLRSELMRNKEVHVTFSNCMFDHLLCIDHRELENIVDRNHVKAKYESKRFVGISGSQVDVDEVQNKFLELVLKKHQEFCKKHAPPDKDVNHVVQSESLDHGADAPGSSVDGPANLVNHEFTPPLPDLGAGASHVALSDTSDTEYIDIEQHIWNYILYKNCNLISEFGLKYECSISAIPCDSGSVKMCKVAIRSNKSNQSKLHEAAEEIAELCRVLMDGDIVECAVNFPSRNDLCFFQSQLESIDVLVASSPCSLIGPSRSMDLAKSKFEAAVRTRNKNSEKSPGEDTVRMVPHDLQNDLLRFETHAGLIIHVRKGNITEQKTEAIVDAANTRLRAGSGVAKAVAEAAGKQVEDECRKYIKDHGELKTSEPMHTSAGKLKSPIRYIIHIAGPDSSNYKDKNVCQEHLQQTFFNCLQYANERLEVCSIAIPAISSGVYGVPKDVVARRAYAALMDYDSRLLENPKLPRRLRDIHFVNIDGETTSVMERVLSEISCDDSSSPPNLLPGANPHSYQDEMMQHVTGNQRQAAIDNGSAPNAELGDQRNQFESGERGQNSWNERGDNGSCDPSKANVTRSNSLSADRKLANAAPAQSHSEQGNLTSASSSEKIDAGSGVKVGEPKSGKVSEFQQNHPLGPVNQGDAAGSGTETVKSIPDDLQDSSVRTREQHDAASVAVAATGDNGGAAAAVNDDGGPQAKAANDGDDKDKKTDDICVICMDEIEHPLKLDCGHVFCEECIAGCFEKHQPKCPSCGLLYGVLRGNQPFGTLRHVTNNWSRLSGYEKYGTIEITYNFPSGTQSDEHPNPGMPYKGTTRTAYLPDSPEGREVLQLLKRAFDARLLFTIDRSVTTGQENVVVWNDIHHKTKPTGPHGYPDPGYLDRVKSELAAKGISADPPVVNAPRKRNKRK